MAYRGGYRGGYRGYRGQQIFRPEIALARAEEFVKVENKEAALQTLQEFLKSRKQRQFTVHHPKIMVLYINLCIELRKSQVAKEGLYQFKALTQHQCPDELQKIIEYYLEQAADRAKKAKKQCKETAGELADIDDLDSCVSPESLMLQAVTQASDSDRAERLHLTPWVKFLWDAYRQCLDVVKNNKVLESLYREVAEKACRFCNKFTRTNEFRKLCDTLRQHLRQIVENNPGQANQIKSQNRTNHLILLAGRDEQHLRSQEMQTEIRIFQLKTAIQMEVWQDAFKAIEDINTLQSHTQRIPKSYPNLARFKSKFMDQLSTVLMRAGQPLFHAATCHQIYFLNREMKTNIQKERLEAMASQTLLATLAIPLTQKHDGLSRLLDMTNQVTEKNQRLAKLLNFERFPTRMQLIEDLKWKHVIRHVPRELAALFNCLEMEFNPLRLAEKTEECMKWLKDTEKNPYFEILSPYLDKIQHVTASRTLQQIAQTYDTIVFDRLLSLIPFYSGFELEQHILDSCRTGALRAKIDHGTNTVSFGSTFDPAPLCVPLADDQHATANEHDWLNQHMNSIATALAKASVVLRTDEARQQREDEFNQAANFFRRTDDKIVEMLVDRKNQIEVYKDQAEHDRAKKEQERKTAKAKAERDRKEKEQNEINKLVAERENERKVAEDYETKLKFVRAKLEEMKMDDKLVTHVEFLDAEDLVKLGQDEADKEFQETIVEKQIGGVREKLINQKRSLGKREEEKDFFERAKRQEETRLRVDSLPKRQARLKHDVKKSYDLAVERSKAQHEESLGYKHKFAHMGVKIAEFTEDITKSAGQQFDKELKAFDDMKSQYIQEKRKQLREEFLTEEREAHEASLEEARGVIKAWEIEEEKRKRQAEAEEKARLQREHREKRMAELEAQAEKERLEREAKAEAARKAEPPVRGPPARNGPSDDRWGGRNQDRRDEPQRSGYGGREERGGYGGREERGGYDRPAPRNNDDFQRPPPRTRDGDGADGSGGWRGNTRRQASPPPRGDGRGGDEGGRWRPRGGDGPPRRFVGRSDRDGDRPPPADDRRGGGSPVRRAGGFESRRDDDIRAPARGADSGGSRWSRQARDDGPRENDRPRQGYGERSDGPIRGPARGGDTGGLRRPPADGGFERGPPRAGDRLERGPPRAGRDDPPRPMGGRPMGGGGDRSEGGGSRWSRPRGESRDQDAPPPKPAPKPKVEEAADDDGWATVR